jgi:hypothetical protein
MNKKKRHEVGQVWWHIPEIPATWELEIRASEFETSPAGKKVSETSYLKKQAGCGGHIRL